MSIGKSNEHIKCTQKLSSAPEICLPLPTPSLGAHGSRDQGAPPFEIGMDNRGRWVKLYEKLIHSSVFQDSYATHLFIYLLLSAQWQSGIYKTIFRGSIRALNAGQLVTGRSKIASLLRISPSNVRNALVRLRGIHKIVDYESDNKRTIITILNWDTYQNEISGKDSASDNKRTTKGQQKDTNQEGYKERKTEIDAFIQFWSSYPRKESKLDAEKAWKKLNPSKELLEKILSSVERSKTSASWVEENGKYIPLPASWIRKRRWEDEVREEPAQNKPCPPLQGALV